MIDQDCLLNCISYIPIGTDLINCMLVCREWNQSINECNHYWNDCFDSMMKQLSIDPKKVFFKLYPKSFLFDVNQLAFLFESYFNINYFIEQYSSVLHLKLTNDCKEKNNIMILVGSVHAQIWKSTFEYYKPHTAKPLVYESFIEFSANKLKHSAIYQVLRELLVTDELINLFPFKNIAVYLDRYKPLLTLETFSKLMLFHWTYPALRYNKKTKNLSYENTLRNYFKIQPNTSNNLILPNESNIENDTTILILISSLYNNNNIGSGNRLQLLKEIFDSKWHPYFDQFIVESR